jgi:hypothetical protein
LNRKKMNDSKTTEGEFVLRPDDDLFELFMYDVVGMIEYENMSRVRKPFVWTPVTGTFRDEMQRIVYRFTNDEKKKLLTDAYNILNGKLVWTDYALIGICYTIRTTLKEKIVNPCGFTCKVLRTPYTLISAVTDGILSGRKKEKTA